MNSNIIVFIIVFYIIIINNNNMYLKSSIQTSSIDYIKENIHITLKISTIYQYNKPKYSNRYMTPIHQNNLETELFLSQI